MNLLGKLTDPAFWQEVREKDCYKNFRDKYIQRWEEECENTPPNTLRYTDWLEFWRTGKRIEFNYFQARQQLLASTFLSLIYPEEQKYIDRVHNQLFVITNEFSWCLPAHYGNPTEGNRLNIDLFAAETGIGLAEVYTMLEDRLDDFIKMRVREEIERRIVNSMAATPKFIFEGMSNNWSSVCGASVAGAIMLMFPERFEEFKPRIDKAMEVFLSGYRDDGVCLEGATYWVYGFGFFCIYADMLEKFYGKKCEYFERAKVKNIATFMQNTFLSGKACVSFSDAGRTGSFNVGFLHFLKKKYPDDIILLKSEFSTDREGTASMAKSVLTIMNFDEQMYYNPEDASVDLTYYAPESEWLIRRLPLFGFAAKGGNNKEPHNHNDIGSFIFAKDGEQMLVDLGPGAYTKQYFSGERYKTFQACSRSHSVPIINGIYQTNGPTFKAKDVSFDGTVFTMDIAGAYNVPELKSLVRRFTILDDGIELSDTVDYEGGGVVTERFATLYEPVIRDGEIDVGTAVIYYDKTAFTPYIVEEQLSKATCYLINFDLSNGEKEFKMTVK